jgi:hypothetical protein
MTPERLVRLVWLSCGLTAALALFGLVMFFVNLGTEVPHVEDVAFGSRAGDAITAVTMLAFAIVGALIAVRRPGNTIGWIFCGAGVALGVANGANEYAIRGLLADPGSLPGAIYAAWLSQWLWVPLSFLAGSFLLLLFPTGHLLSRRWRPVAWVAVAGLVAIAVGFALAPGPLDDSPFVQFDSPLGVDSEAVDVLAVVGFFPWFASFIAAAISLVLRYRRGSADERRQIRWIVGAALLFVAAFVTSAAVYDETDAGASVVATLSLLAMTGIPVATGIAIFRYRLYDIDVIVRRTLVYGVLTAGLAGLYFGIVLALQQVFSSFAGGSDLAIAGSTLAVAALFRPGRRRIQRVVDRRFNRRTYDAQRTIERFAVRLRDEIDLDSLGGELRGVVQETMQPAHVTLWLRRSEVEP